jgi:glyoxylase-like metal-dependent hydrolase (beta-lactamase superfamily II)
MASVNGTGPQGTRRAFLSGAAGFVAAGMLPAPARAESVARLGPREVLTISDGSFTVPLAMLARGVQPDTLVAALRDAGHPIDQARMPLNITLIRDGDRYTVIDCGAGGHFLAGSGQFAASLDAAGIDRARVSRVLFTHAHPDHLWGAIDEFDSALFPAARYGMAAAEIAFWTAEDVYSRLPEDRHAFAAGAQRVLKTLGDRLERFAPGQEVAPGILAVETAGHTPGHVAFEVAGGGETLLVLGDALIHPVISCRYPDWRSVADIDPDLAVATRWRLLERLATDRVPVIAYHFPAPGLGRIERAGSAYRVVAA